MDTLVKPCDEQHSEHGCRDYLGIMPQLILSVSPFIQLNPHWGRSSQEKSTSCTPQLVIASLISLINPAAGSVNTRRQPSVWQPPPVPPPPLALALAGYARDDVPIRFQLLLRFFFRWLCCVPSAPFAPLLFGFVSVFSFGLGFGFICCPCSHSSFLAIGKLSRSWHELLHYSPGWNAGMPGCRDADDAGMSPT